MRLQLNSRTILIIILFVSMAGLVICYRIIPQASENFKKKKKKKKKKGPPRNVSTEQKFRFRQFSDYKNYETKTDLPDGIDFNVFYSIDSNGYILEDGEKIKNLKFAFTFEDDFTNIVENLPDYTDRDEDDRTHIWEVE
jgi:lipopolysaccharide export LptBFGC system permease protein LptF